MSEDRWEQVERVFQRAAELQLPERVRFLAVVCAGDDHLRREIESLLAHDRSQGDDLAAAISNAASDLPDSLLRYEAATAEPDPNGPLDPHVRSGIYETGIGPYRLLQKIGEGGMGDVWLAEQREPVRRRVALKVVKAGMNTRDVMARFESERQALALMDHPAIARVFDAGYTPQGAPYFVMEYVAGMAITAYCDNHRLSTRERLDLFIGVCEGVQHAHHKAIIHRDLGAAPFAYFGSWSRTGFAQRLDALSRSVEAGDANMDASLEAISRHEIVRCFGRERVWMDRAQMAVRLRRWLNTPETPVSNWAETVGSYTAGGAWVDTARQALFTGDEPQDIARRWRSLDGAAEHRRDRENLVFAKNLAVVSAADLPLAPAVPIESVLERVLAPWGKEKTLLIVMDGMSFAVWHELQSEVEGRNWRPQSWSEGQPLPPAVTVLPSATTFSRCTLLCGRLASGGQEVEKKGFAENEALRAVSRAGFPPVLFHKDEVGTGSHAISEALRRELRNDGRKIVGVVINVIDDSLSGPEQRSFRWSLDQIPIARALLDEAELSGRTVVIASDHGHVLDRGAEMRKTDGDRYRMDRYRPIETGLCRPMRSSSLAGGYWKARDA